MTVQIAADPERNVAASPSSAARHQRPACRTLQWTCWTMALVVIAGLLTGCRSSSPAPNAYLPSFNTSPAGAKSATSVRLQEGDVVRIASEGATNVNTIAKVQFDGSISLPLLGEVKVLGKTLPEVQTDLNKRYERVLQPGYDISVSLVTVAASIYVSGAVLRPGRLPMDRPMTLLEAIMEAGGFDFNRAKPSQVMVFRVEHGLQYHFKFDLKRTLQGKDSGVFYLKPFDIVHVPEKTFNF